MNDNLCLRSPPLLSGLDGAHREADGGQGEADGGQGEADGGQVRVDTGMKRGRPKHRVEPLKKTYRDFKIDELWKSRYLKEQTVFT